MTKSEAKTKALVEYLRDFRAVAISEAVVFNKRLENGFQHASRCAKYVPVLDEYENATGLVKTGGNYDNAKTSLTAYLDMLKKAMAFTKRHFLCDVIEKKISGFIQDQPAYMILNPYMTAMTKFLHIAVFREYPSKQTGPRFKNEYTHNLVRFHLNFLPEEDKWINNDKSLKKLTPSSYDFNLALLHKTYGQGSDLGYVITEFRHRHLSLPQHGHEIKSFIGSDTKFLMLSRGHVNFSLTPVNETDMSKLVISKCEVYHSL